MKYIKEAKQILKDVFFEDWMDEEDWQEFEKELFGKTNISYESLAKDLETGVENGHSVEYQKTLIKLMLKK